MRIDRNILKKAPWIVAAGIAGAIGFALAQTIAGFPMTIAEFMGTQIVSRGGYSPSLAGPIGWSVHLGVAVTYATLFALATYLPGFPRRGAPRLVLAAGVAVLFGWVATLLTAPAIATTISVLAGQGLPTSLPPLNTAGGFALWNHIGYFAIIYMIEVVVPELRARRGSLVPAPQLS